MRGRRSRRRGKDLPADVAEDAPLDDEARAAQRGEGEAEGPRRQRRERGGLRDADRTARAEDPVEPLR